jgi:hypothetical protein
MDQGGGIVSAGMTIGKQKPQLSSLETAVTIDENFAIFPFHPLNLTLRSQIEGQQPINCRQDQGVKMGGEKF